MNSTVEKTKTMKSKIHIARDGYSTAVLCDGKPKLFCVSQSTVKILPHENHCKHCKKAMDKLTNKISTNRCK